LNRTACVLRSPAVCNMQTFASFGPFFLKSY
jgi:hypothetical protein